MSSPHSDKRRITDANRIVLLRRGRIDRNGTHRRPLASQPITLLKYRYRQLTIKKRIRKRHHRPEAGRNRRPCGELAPACVIIFISSTASISTTTAAPYLPNTCRRIPSSRVCRRNDGLRRKGEARRNTPKIHQGASGLPFASSESLAKFKTGHAFSW